MPRQRYIHETKFKIYSNGSGETRFHAVSSCLTEAYLNDPNRLNSEVAKVVQKLNGRERDCELRIIEEMGRPAHMLTGSILNFKRE